MLFLQLRIEAESKARTLAKNTLAKVTTLHKTSGIAKQTVLKSGLDALSAGNTSSYTINSEEIKTRVKELQAENDSLKNELAQAKKKIQKLQEDKKQNHVSDLLAMRQGTYTYAFIKVYYTFLQSINNLYKFRLQTCTTLRIKLTRWIEKVCA